MVSNSIIIGKSDLSSAVSKPSRISSKKQTSLQSGEQSGSFSDLLIDNGSPITSAEVGKNAETTSGGQSGQEDNLSEDTGAASDQGEFIQSDSLKKISALKGAEPTSAKVLSKKTHPDDIPMEGANSGSDNSSTSSTDASDAPKDDKQIPSQSITPELLASLANTIVVTCQGEQAPQSCALSQDEGGSQNSITDSDGEELAILGNSSRSRQSSSFAFGSDLTLISNSSSGTDDTSLIEQSINPSGKSEGTLEAAIDKKNNDESSDDITSTISEESKSIPQSATDSIDNTSMQWGNISHVDISSGTNLVANPLNTATGTPTKQVQNDNVDKVQTVISSHLNSTDGLEPSYLTAKSASFTSSVDKLSQDRSITIKDVSVQPTIHAVANGLWSIGHIFSSDVGGEISDASDEVLSDYSGSLATNGSASGIDLAGQGTSDIHQSILAKAKTDTDKLDDYSPQYGGKISDGSTLQAGTPEGSSDISGSTLSNDSQGGEGGYSNDPSDRKDDLAEVELSDSQHHLAESTISSGFIKEIANAGPEWSTSKDASSVRGSLDLGNGDDDIDNGLYDISGNSVSVTENSFGTRSSLSMIIESNDFSPVKIRVEKKTNGDVSSVTLQADSHEATEALKRHHSELLDSLSLAGLDIADMKVEVVSSSENSHLNEEASPNDAGSESFGRRGSSGGEGASSQDQEKNRGEWPSRDNLSVSSRLFGSPAVLSGEDADIAVSHRSGRVNITA
ncbi:hypothetical protein CSR02_14560 [Acetobacter pomorum]|uniref:Flagellar hook-length control protein-like C-terminal domain-containing protein n=1 Tax=Acetobacter pomorum TaxID=65959 RepID=A0A2G4R8G0_9PROT|nr:flagellar hook-length control protein FliK [Acetobacter pomorum]PHY92848.1 hypothetical protein CSR02_14560 [Acetobacter pomorum]GBR53128.1 hypothetical protein AA11825_2406 [Acetobacter pomorum DSM 11825]